MSEITLIPGDSDANTRAVLHMLRGLDAGLTFDRQDFGGAEPSEALLASARRTGRVLMGHRQQAQKDQQAPIVALRKSLGIFANLRPVHGVRGIPARFPNADVLVVRETTEDVYAQLEHESIPGTFESLKVTTEAACERIARFAFDTARAKGRKRVTIVHKSNIMKKSDGLFLRTAQRVGAEYSDVDCDECIVDALCMKLVRNPNQFDVLVCGNLFGDIVADLCAGLVGGTPNAPSVNVGADDVTVYTPGHGEADASAQTSCPTSLAFAAVLMLRDMGKADAADRLMGALQDTMEAGTKPVAAGGQATAEQFASAVSQRLQ